MSFALREQRRIIVFGAIWILFSVLAVVTGAFGLDQRLSVPMQLLYWGTIVGISVLGSALAIRVAKGRGRVSKGLLWTCYSFAITSAVHVLNRLVFGIWPDVIGFLNLLIIIGIIIAVVHVGLLVIAFASPQLAGVQDGSTDPSLKFLKRLPNADRGKLVRIEAQDHYLNVVTQNGSALILMRLGEAINELDGFAGLQVHRSHWVALDGVKGHRREQGRDLLILSDGAKVPVSRSQKAAAKSAGLL